MRSSNWWRPTCAAERAQGSTPIRPGAREVSLRHFLTTLAALLLGCGAAFAQITPPIPGALAIGATSPFGVPGATSSVGPVGIPMGATELAPGGLSPAPLADVSSAPAGPSSTFDGAGMSSGSMGSGTASFGVSSRPAGLAGSCGPRFTFLGRLSQTRLSPDLRCFAVLIMLPLYWFSVATTIVCARRATQVAPARLGSTSL